MRDPDALAREYGRLEAALGEVLHLARVGRFAAPASSSTSWLVSMIEDRGYLMLDQYGPPRRLTPDGRWDDPPPTPPVQEKKPDDR